MYNKGSINFIFFAKVILNVIIDKLVNTYRSNYLGILRKNRLWFRYFIGFKDKNISLGER